MKDSTEDCMSQAWRRYIPLSCKFHFSKLGHMSALNPKGEWNIHYLFAQVKDKMRIESCQPLPQGSSILKPIMSLIE